MKKIEAIVRPSKLEPLKEALSQVNIKGMTVSEVHGVGNQGGWKEYYRGTEVLINMLPKVKFEIVTTDDRVQELLGVIIETAKSGNDGEVGDGKIFVSSVDEVVRIRTGECGEVAI